MEKMIKMEELVNKLAGLQAELDRELVGADFASANVDSRIVEAEEMLLRLEKERALNRQPYIEAAEEIKTTIGGLYETIIAEWSGEKKTIEFGAGTLKFRTTQSINIVDRVWLLGELLDHTSLEDVATKYISGFSKTAVKKYMSVHELPIDVAEIVYKTTAKLEQESG